MSERGDFYTVLQAAEVLNVTPKRVYEMLAEGELEAPYVEGAWYPLINIHSVHTHLKVCSSVRTHPKELPAEPHDSHDAATTVLGFDDTLKENRFFDLDLVILLMIGGITLLAAGYTLLPML